jgi:integrase
MPRAVVEGVGIEHDGQHSPAVGRADHEYGTPDAWPRVADHDAIAVADLADLLGSDVMVGELLNRRLGDQQDRDQHRVKVLPAMDLLCHTPSEEHDDCDDPRRTEEPCSVMLDAAGRRRSPATLPGYAHGRPPRNKGLQYPADPPSVEEIIRVMRCAGVRPEGLRMRALIVVLWRAGLRISEALALAESDLDPRRGSILVRCGKGGKRREVGMDARAWEQLTPWLELRRTMPVGALLCVIYGATRGRPWTATAARAQLRRVAARSGVRRRFAHISCDMPTPLRWHAKKSHWSSSSASSATATWASRRSTCKASTAARSSIPSTPAELR